MTMQNTNTQGVSGETLPGSSIKALIVDDSFLMRAAVKRILETEMAGIEIELAADGQEALDKIKSDEFDIVLSDIEMPVMDGVEFIKRCKINSDARIIILSSLARIDSTKVEKAVFYGADGVVAKPNGSMDKKQDEIIQLVLKLAPKRI